MANICRTFILLWRYLSIYAATKRSTQLNSAGKEGKTESKHTIRRKSSIKYYKIITLVTLCAVMRGMKNKALLENDETSTSITTSVIKLVTEYSNVVSSELNEKRKEKRRKNFSTYISPMIFYCFYTLRKAITHKLL